MQFKTGLLMFLGLSCLLFTAACVERQPQSGSVTAPMNGNVTSGKVPAVQSDTQDYVHGWTHPTGDDSGKPVSPAESKASRERMLPNETDSYQRAWTFPTDETKTSKKSPAAAKPRSKAPKVQLPNDTEEYVNGWTFE